MASRAEAGNSAIVTLILSVLVMFVLVVFFTGALDIFKKSADDETCRMTVLAQHNKNIFGKGLVSLNCPRHEIKVTDNAAMIVQDGKEKTLTRFRPRLTENTSQFYKLVADEMADCWFKMGEGNLNVFNSNMVVLRRYPCIICSHITFDMDKRELGTPEGFIEYLKENSYQKHGMDQKYYDYMLMQYPAKWTRALYPLYIEAGGSILIKGFADQEKLMSDQEYVVFFNAMKFPEHVLTGSDDLDNFLSTKDNYYIFFAKPETLPEECSVLIN